MAVLEEYSVTALARIHSQLAQSIQTRPTRCVGSWGAFILMDARNFPTMKKDHLKEFRKNFKIAKTADLQHVAEAVNAIY